MFLVMKANPSTPTGWEPVTLSGAETAEEAAKEGYQGSTDQLAVLEWNPSNFRVETKVEITSTETEDST